MENPLLSGEISPLKGPAINLAFDPRRYIASQELISAANIALTLGQPLLLTGEPGVGKSMFAHYLADKLGLPQPLVYIAKTDSTPIDLFYHYDHLLHFHDANSARLAGQTLQLNTTDYYERYISFQALGAAIRSGERKVVLIDEIDKASRDFPNNLLNELEHMSFGVRETGEQFTASPDAMPVVVITSNAERNLPDAFLRRCIYYHLPFPANEQLFHILKGYVSRYQEKELQQLLDFFERVRTLSIRKPPSIAELIQWVRLLETAEVDPAEFLGNVREKSGKNTFFSSSLSVLAKTREDLEVLRPQLFYD